MIPEGTAAASEGIRPVTLAIHEDEKAWWLVELNLVRPPSRQWHRWQIVTVNRGDRLADWWFDLGPKENFDAPEIAIPGIWEETVASLRDIAEYQRNETARFKARMAEHRAASTLIPDMLRQFEVGKKVMENQSSFGPLTSIQRNGFDRRALV